MKNKQTSDLPIVVYYVLALQHYACKTLHCCRLTPLFQRSWCLLVWRTHGEEVLRGRLRCLRKRNAPSAQQPLLPEGIEKERRGNTEGISIEAKESRIVKRAKIATGVVKGQRKEDKTIPPVATKRPLK